MGSWSTRRRLIYGLSLVLFLALITLTLFFKVWYQKPTCSDGRQNGDEIGVDCGGSCQSLCTSQALTPIVLWSKVFNISGDVYNAAAYVENPNINSSNPRVTYKFDIFDVNNMLIESRMGETFIPRNKKFVVFEPGFTFKGKIPKRVDFQFISYGTWVKDAENDPDLAMKYSSLLATSTVPRIEGTITNNSLTNLSKIELTTLVSDGKQNVIASSRTYIDALPQSVTEPFVFTWPKPFNLGVESCENPVDIALVLDKSTSMRSESINPPEPFSTVKAVAKDFVQNLSGNDQVSIVSFGTNAAQVSDLSLDSTQAIKGIESLTLSTTTEQTNIGEGLTFAFRELSSSRGRVDSKKVIILLTDGIPTEPKVTGRPDYPTTFAEAISKTVSSEGITVYTIGLGDSVNTEFLKTIASDNNHYFFAPNKSTLSGIYSNIGSSLCQKKPNAIQVIYRIL